MTGSATLSARDLTRSFAGVRAVSDVSFDLLPHDLTVLIGPNGAGKTTIFNLLTGVHRLDSGSVLIDGVDVTGTSPEARARLGIGRTFQDVRLFDGMTASENVEVYALPTNASSMWRTLIRPRVTAIESRNARRLALESLDRVGIAHLARQAVGQLSYAQQKLVSIARILAAGSRIVLLDEPASGVDQSGREQLCQIVRSLADDGLAVCVVEHNLDVVRELAKKLIFLAEGTVLAAGAPEHIFASSELADVYFGSGAAG